MVALIHQVEPLFDTSGNFKLYINVEDGVPHIWGSFNGKPAKGCYECARYEELLKRRERESYPNVEEES